MTLAARLFLFLGGINAALVIALGAYGAHALQAREHTALFQTATQYHFFHALGLIAVGLVAAQQHGRWLLIAAGSLMLIGILLFCGTIYLAAITGNRTLSSLTPIGGMAFLLAWLLFAVAAIRH
jgi:uncharacterized membrane protein YgdD (TMEM256/DUF423 family)